MRRDHINRHYWYTFICIIHVHFLCTYEEIIPMLTKNCMQCIYYVTMMKYKYNFTLVHNNVLYSSMEAAINNNYSNSFKHWKSCITLTCIVQCDYLWNAVVAQFCAIFVRKRAMFPYSFPLNVTSFMIVCCVHVLLDLLRCTNFDAENLHFTFLFCFSF